MRPERLVLNPGLSWVGVFFWPPVVSFRGVARYLAAFKGAVIMRSILFAFALVPTVLMAQDAPSPLNLICGGAGSANKVTSSQAFGSNNYGDSATATITGTRSVGFADEVRLRIDGEIAELRMPRTMLPPIRGGKDGWFKIKNLKFTDGEITGSVAVSLVNNPKMRLDRYSGAISISGKAGDYAGRCMKFDPTTTERAF